MNNNEQKPIVIPGSLSKMTMKEYLDLMTIININKDDESKMNDLIVQYFTGYTDTELKKMLASDYEMILSVVTKVLGETPKLKLTFKVEGKTFGFIPKLESMTVNEYIAADNFIKDMSTYPEFMTVIYRPVIKAKLFGIFKKRAAGYQIEDFESPEIYRDIMLKAPASIFVGALVFFWTLRRDLLIATLHSSMEKLKKIKASTIQEKNTLQKSMDGLTQSIMLLENDTNQWSMLQK